MPPPRNRTRGRKLPPGVGPTRRSNAISEAPPVSASELLHTDNETVSMEVDQESESAKTWIKEKVDEEVARIRATGTSIEPLAAKNFGIVVDLSRKKATAINRIEINSNLDFKKVQQIMVSAGIPYPHKENYEYVNVLLFSENAETPMLVPYLYDTKFRTQEPLESDDKETASSTASSTDSPDGAPAVQRPWINVKNNLTEWLLVNAQNARARHHIDEFHDI